MTHLKTERYVILQLKNFRESIPETNLAKNLISGRHISFFAAKSREIKRGQRFLNDTFSESKSTTQKWNFENRSGDTYLFSTWRIFQTWHRYTKMKFYQIQWQHGFLLDHQKWWLHTKFQHPRFILSRDIVIYLFKIKIQFPP